MVVPARVVVVGAGPSGLSAAYLLAEAGSEVTVLERLEHPSATAPSRAFSYAITEHGMPTMKRIGMYEALKEVAVPFSSAFAMYKAGASPMKLPPSPFDKMANMWWISRSKLLDMMLENVHEQGLVDLRLGVGAGEVSYSKNVAAVQLIGAGGQNLGVIHADLVLGCDGLRSVVRRQLTENGRTGTSVPESRNGFESVKTRNSSSGILYKSMNFDALPKFPPLKNEVGHHVAPPDEMVWITSRSRFSFSANAQKQLILFPTSADRKDERYGSIGDSPGASIWKVKTADEAYDLLQGYFPQIDFRKIVRRHEMTKFVQAPPGRIPDIQRCLSMGGWCGDNVGVALLGDAAKCFPPDLGQGVNSSLEDVTVLVDALRDSACVREAVQLYEARREADIIAICRLLKIGFAFLTLTRPPPLEYNSKKANFILRLMLNMVAPRFFHPPATVLMGKTSYSEALKKANQTTARIGAISAIIVGFGITFFLRSMFI